MLVYCLDIRGRLAADDATGIKLLTEALGKQMWNHAIFVLTFANTVEAKDGKDADTVLQEKISSWVDAITRLLKKNLNFPDDIVEKITIVSTGYRSHQPPGIDDWFSSFWAASFKKTKPSAQPSLLGINAGRLSSEKSASKDGEASEEPYKMPIRLSAGQHTAATTGTGALIGLVAGAVVAGPVGAAVGTAIGAVAGGGVGYVSNVVLDSIFGKQ